MLAAPSHLFSQVASSTGQNAWLLLASACLCAIHLLYGSCLSFFWPTSDYLKRYLLLMCRIFPPFFTKYYPNVGLFLLTMCYNAVYCCQTPICWQATTTGCAVVFVEMPTLPMHLLLMHYADETAGLLQYRLLQRCLEETFLSMQPYGDAALHHTAWEKATKMLHSNMLW